MRVSHYFRGTKHGDIAHLPEDYQWKSLNLQMIKMHIWLRQGQYWQISTYGTRSIDSNFQFAEGEGGGEVLLHNNLVLEELSYRAVDALPAQ